MDPENPGMQEAVQNGLDGADAEGKTPEMREAEEKESKEVKRLWKEYETARKFDMDARAQYAIDRRYAAGTANLDWAVSANLIGAFIDILVSFLYARNPDVSIKKAPRMDNRGTRQEDDFAKTLELVVSSLWRAPGTRLKKKARQMVRSALTNGPGWLKITMVSDGPNVPQMEAQLNDLRQNIADLEATQRKILEEATENGEGYEGAHDDEMEAEYGRLLELKESLENKLEVAIRKGLAVDFVSPEDMQVALDVREISDYVDASWNANAIYRPTCDLQSMFPRLTEADCKKAKQYYQRRVKDLQPMSDRIKLTGLIGASATEADAAQAEQYVSDASASGASEGQGITFARIIELWDRRTGHVKTMVEGIDKWAKEPYQPDYPTSRFFPYFEVEFYSVDGARHPQSLSWRLMKLEDEYCSLRSNLRLTRQRATPGTMFDASELSPEEAKKLERSTQQEFIGIRPTSPGKPLRDMFAPKPVEIGDGRLYDPTQVMSDMERISGVQEALQSSVNTEKTATEAEIQQSGFASRTTADRDTLETMLTDLAHYTAEMSLSALTTRDVARIAGKTSFWPEGMDIEDLLTMVEINIEAGTTGKPRSSGDREAWGVVLPSLEKAILQIQQAQLMGNMPLAESLSELVRETMARMGDDTDPDRFIPKLPEQIAPEPGVGGPPPVGPDGQPLPPAPGEGAMPGDPNANVPPELQPGSMPEPDLQPPM